MGSDGSNLQPPDRQRGLGLFSVMVSGWPSHRLHVQARRQLGDLRDGA